MQNNIATSNFRMLSDAELRVISGGTDTIGYKPTCPVDDWWPDMFEDWGDVEEMPGDGAGPYQQYWTDGSTWCFYDDDGELLGQYVEDPNGSFQVTFEGTDGADSASFSVAGTGGGGSNGDSSSSSVTITLSRVGG